VLDESTGETNLKRLGLVHTAKPGIFP
jgi:hypothetical protein